ncbi:arylsulfatase [Reichenbachiella sp. MALMAid0571]|uniref:arylsulfatase n=1 Tax=Reichenbachiella sp. MALMAid0571 TaxID=3143939 RepID=UPI0032DF2E7B
MAQHFFSSYGIKLCIAFIALTALFSCAKNEVDVTPNIVFILTDDQGWGDLSINGNSNINTPNIDELARQGTIFDRFYVSPVCSPTRAELLTGRYHVRGGVYSTSAGGERLDLDETTIAQTFKQAGYQTAVIGKWHNGMQYPYHPNGRGFDEFYGFCSGHWGNYFAPLLEHNGQLVQGEGFIIDDFTNKAITFIENNKSNPFFLYLPYNTPHSPMQIPDEWWRKYENKELKMLHRNPEKEDLQHTRAALAMCENIDWNVGRLIKKLDELKLTENTIIAYLSDNGPNGYRWNGNMKGKKGSTDEGGVRSPLIVQWKGKIDAGKKITKISSMLDLYPTLTKLAGIRFSPKKPLDGKSLKPLLIENDSDWEDRYIINNWRNSTSVRSQRFRLDAEDNLYHMIKDPGQSTDVSDQYPDIKKEMMNIKDQWKTDVLSELPKKDLRTFPVGHPDFEYTQIPAQDGQAHGNIQRSNRWPNCSYFTNWTDEKDYISWDIEVLEEGDYDATIYYTCSKENTGSTIELIFDSDTLKTKITEPHDPPLIGMQYDRHKRIESYTKDFKPLNMGAIHLNKNTGQLILQAPDIPGKEALDFRLLLLKKQNFTPKI